jgi:hypothetical protein
LRSTSVTLLFLVATACNFDDAFNRYCKNNPQCSADAAADAPAGNDGSRGQDADTSSPPVDAPAGNDGSVGQDADTSSLPPIPPPFSCDPSSSTPCPRATDICDPVALVCLIRCNSQSDCPDYLDSCEPLLPNGGATMPSVCRCSSTEACVNRGGSAFACHRDDRLCERLCNSTRDCSIFLPQHRVCDRISQLCLGCLTAMDCFSPSQPACDRATERCTGCTSNADCANRPDGLYQCTPSGACAAF